MLWKRLGMRGKRGHMSAGFSGQHNPQGPRQLTGTLQLPASSTLTTQGDTLVAQESTGTTETPQTHSVLSAQVEEVTRKHGAKTSDCPAPSCLGPL